MNGTGCLHVTRNWSTRDQLKRGSVKSNCSASHLREQVEILKAKKLKKNSSLKSVIEQGGATVLCPMFENWHTRDQLERGSLNRNNSVSRTVWRHTYGNKLKS